MASVYILYSNSADKFYIGSTKDQVKRLEYHKEKEFSSSFTAKYNEVKEIIVLIKVYLYFYSLTARNIVCCLKFRWQIL